MRKIAFWLVCNVRLPGWCGAYIMGLALGRMPHKVQGKQS